MIPKDKISIYFLYFTFNGLKKHFHDLAGGGSATLNMNTSTFANILIASPSEMLLRIYANNVDNLMARILANQKGSKTLSELRNLLLPILLSGKITVSAPERLIEESE